MELLPKEMKNTQEFGKNGLDDIKYFLEYHSATYEIYKDDYFINVYLKNITKAKGELLAFGLYCIIKSIEIIEENYNNLKARYQQKHPSSGRDLDKEIKKISEVKQLVSLYSSENNTQSKELQSYLEQCMSELKYLKTSLKSKIRKFDNNFTVLLSAHENNHSKGILDKRIDYFKPKPQHMNEIINQQKRVTIDSFQLSKIPYNNLDINALFDYLKEHYKLA